MLDAHELRLRRTQGGLGEVSRAITQVFLVTHFTSGEPALVIYNTVHSDLSHKKTGKERPCPFS